MDFHLHVMKHKEILFYTLNKSFSFLNILHKSCSYFFLSFCFFFCSHFVIIITAVEGKIPTTAI